MTRFVIENRVQNPEGLKDFAYEGFCYNPHLGEADYPHFVKE